MSRLARQERAPAPTGDTRFYTVFAAQTGKLIEENKIHDAAINDLQLSVDGSHFVTASNDRTAKLVDTSTLEELKVYQTERNANSAALSPIEDHVCPSCPPHACLMFGWDPACKLLAMSLLMQ